MSDIIWSPAAIRAYVKNVDEGYQSLNGDTERELQSIGPEVADKMFYPQWLEALGHWVEFRDKVLDSPSILLSGSDVDTTEAFHIKLKLWWKRYSDPAFAGKQPSGIFPPFPRESQPERNGDGVDFEMLAVGGLVVIGLFGLGYLISSAKKK